MSILPKCIYCGKGIRGEPAGFGNSYPWHQRCLDRENAREAIRIARYAQYETQEELEGR